MFHPTDSFFIFQSTQQRATFGCWTSSESRIYIHRLHRFFCHHLCNLRNLWMFLFKRLLQEPSQDRMLKLVRMIIGERVVNVPIVRLEVDRHIR